MCAWIAVYKSEPEGADRTTEIIAAVFDLRDEEWNDRSC